MEKVVNTEFWKGRRVAITGHTGFKGSWLSLWLHELKADVWGYALPPETQPTLFKQLQLEENLHHTQGDIRDAFKVKKWVQMALPEVVFHLAAQPLVLQSYREPQTTWETNVLGAVYLLEAVRLLDTPCAVVLITTDKVYENREWVFAYREADRLGGHDPYSSSKAAAEMAVASWRASFFSKAAQVRIATARAGNVIGGGDWAEDRIIPDLVRALTVDKPAKVRNPNAVRPWQHVLEPLCGYLQLAEKLVMDDDPKWQSAFNFGPEASNFRTVRDLVETSLQHWPGNWHTQFDLGAPHEANFLSLTIEKARRQLKWAPIWNFQEAVRQTMTWYYEVHRKQSIALEMSRMQIQKYSEN